MNKKLAIVLSVAVILVTALSANTHRNNIDFNQSASAEFGENSVSKMSKYVGRDWTLKNLNGEMMTLSDSQGKPTLLVFWATWCPYCKKLLPGIEALHEKYSAKGLKILGVNIKEDWKPKVYWKNFGYQFDTVIEGDDVAKIYGITSTPGLVFIAPSGKVLGVQSFSDPNHPLLERFAQEGIALMKK